MDSLSSEESYKVYRRKTRDSGPNQTHSTSNQFATFAHQSPHLGDLNLIAPNTPLAQVIMGNANSSTQNHSQKSETDNRIQNQLSQQASDAVQPPPPGPSSAPRESNLTLLMRQQAQAQQTHQPPPISQASAASEADSASGPPPPRKRNHPLGSSAPMVFPDTHKNEKSQSAGNLYHSDHHGRVRRSSSNAEVKAIAPLSGSPYANMLTRKFEIERSMERRLRKLREDESSSTSSKIGVGSNEQRNKRRAEHTQAVIDDLCEVVTDLFIAESKLLNPSVYGVAHGHTDRTKLMTAVRAFLSALPNRYALGADTPSEVLLHMRIMAAARADPTKAALHIHKVENEEKWRHIQTQKTTSLRVVTLACGDADGLLEFITKLLSSNGSRVLDADVMLSSDGIVLDRFVVEMNGRLRLDKAVNLVEGFLRKANEAKSQESSISSHDLGTGGPVYFREQVSFSSNVPRDITADLASAVPLSEVISSASAASLQFPVLRKFRSMPPAGRAAPPDLGVPKVSLPMRKEPLVQDTGFDDDVGVPIENSEERKVSKRKELVNRPASSYLGSFGDDTSQKETSDKEESQQYDQGRLEYFRVPASIHGSGIGLVERDIPIIPFDELMLIETVGTGRVSTIYRAVWKSSEAGVKMVALKVAMVNSENGDTSHTEELQREADIAGRLQHPHICDLVGIASDPDCFCLAYDFCEGGSLHSLLADTTRYYDYLPIAMDIANGMAYLHSRNVIHRDLKPSNILLTRDHRAKIADFGLSVTNRGQELTAETGTYRYMAPECIRHEQYSSNADVYSFGLCLWQLITREVPFSTMTPIQAAYAVAEGKRPDIPSSTPRRLREIITACWDQDSYKRPSFTYIAMALADYVRMAFNPANVGAQTLQIANEMLATVDGNATINVDFTTSVFSNDPLLRSMSRTDSGSSGNLGLEIE